MLAMKPFLIKREGCFIFEPFLAQGVTAAFSTRVRDFATKTGQEGEEKTAWSEFCTITNTPLERISHFKQVHGDRIVQVDERARVPGFPRVESVREEADGAITHEVNRPLVMFTADCAPVFFFDPKSRVAGIAHAGWRGAQQKLPSKIVSKLKASFGAIPKDLMVGLGPMIHSCCYEVGPEFNQFFPGCVEERASHYFFDLPGAIKNDLLEAGVAESNILDSHRCTACETELFFSYRKEKEKAGRLCSLIMIRRD